MFPLLKKVETWVRNQWVDATVGFILLFTALNDTGDTLVDDVMTGNVGTSTGFWFSDWPMGSGQSRP